ncbi:DNA polymerase nu [Gouania willdenowi]|uniref:DNA polymerase nu n=1 Tax=Gouania willdenowi TaxID=441366 RepID=UPI001055DED1|nr:DNA polymerase nu [Gouania willdenowi]
MCVAAVQSPSHLTPLLPSLPLKRQREKLQDPHDIPKSKICLTWCPPKCKTPFSKAKKQGEGGICEMKKTKMSTSASGHPVVVAQESKTLVLPSHHTDTDTESGKQSLKPNSTNISSFKSGKHSLIKTLTDRKCFERVHEEFTATEPKIRSKASSCLTAALTSDTRVRDSDKMNPDEKMQMLKKAHEAKVLLLTLVHRDGTTQLDSEQKLTTTVCGLFVLMKSDIQCSAVEDSLGPDDSLMYLKLEQTPAWALQQIHHSQQAFTRDLLHLMLSSSELVVCYKAKDLLRTALQIYNEDLNWKQVAGCHIQDPQVSGWLLDAADPSSCFQSLLHKHFRRQFTIPAVGSQKVSQVISGLTWLLRLHLKLHSDLKNQRLWCLYTNMELKMIPVLAAMESHRIHVDKETLKKTSDFLGTKMKQLEQEAHQAAGQKFLLTSNTQLRTVLFEKLRLHERCENKKLPKTINKQQHSTSEAALLQLQDLHPLPKIILEYRQVHKIKSTFVDGILSCMMSKSYISSTWHQTSAVTGRISAKHPGQI